MNEVLKAIASRYSCRDFADTPLTEEQINALIDAALAAPSAVNRQPWHVVVVKDKMFVNELDAAGMDVLAAAENKSGYDRIMSRGGRLFYNAPCMVFVAVEDSKYALHDCGILVQNIALAAHSMGLASVICGMAAIPLSGAKGAEYISRLKFPEGYSFGMAVCLGVPNSGKEPHELDRSKVVIIN